MNIETRSLTVKLSKAELEQRGQELSEKLRKLDEADEARKEAAAAAREELRKINADMRKLGRSVSTGEELRNIECAWKGDYKHAVFSLVRLDTKAVVETRAMTAEELQEARQVRLPLKGVEPKAEKKPHGKKLKAVPAA